MKSQKTTVIGTGALGSTLARALSSHGVTVSGLYNRSPQLLHTLVEEIKRAHTGTFPPSLSAMGDVCFITVPDGEIANTARRLSKLSDDFTGRIIIHCSGNKTSKELSALQQKGASVASFHPLQTFTATSKPDHLSGIYFDVEGDAQAVSFLKGLAKLFGSRYLEINPEAKPYLHAAAVMASNYLVALLDSSSKIAKMGDIPENEARAALLPLVHQSLQNSSKAHSLPEALSGPIARGDVSTVETHLKLLEQNAVMLALYKQLGSQALEIARDGDLISDEQYSELLSLLTK